MYTVNHEKLEWELNLENSPFLANRIYWCILYPLPAKYAIRKLVALNLVDFCNSGKLNSTPTPHLSVYNSLVIHSCYEVSVMITSGHIGNVWFIYLYSK